MLTIAAQMFIAACLSTPYAARSYFFVTFSSTKDASSVDVFHLCLLLTARLTSLFLFVQSLSLLGTLFGTKKTTIELSLVSKCAE
ncbi:hypothetical protein T05_10282 [Trichinella murrelli]|uniref:Uncharacterized protein n=1 Tax=Trichinella murrelli TaxID=144512 RepID=A0A0V0U880_9BILA|nr:hypothetical protein T05_10282 [Trichinella murrelli]